MCKDSDVFLVGLEWISKDTWSLHFPFQILILVQCSTKESLDLGTSLVVAQIQHMKMSSWMQHHSPGKNLSWYLQEPNVHHNIKIQCLAKKHYTSCVAILRFRACLIVILRLTTFATFSSKIRLRLVYQIVSHILASLGESWHTILTHWHVGLSW